MPRHSGPLARPTVRRVVLSDAAAAKVRQEMIARGADYSAPAVADYVSGGILAADDPRVVTVTLTEPPAVALAWLSARRDDSTPKDIDQIIAALWSTAHR